MKALFKKVLTFSTLALVSATASVYAQTSDSPTPTSVQCQAIDSFDVANPQFAVENFDKNTQAFIMCATLQGESGPEVFLTGTVPLKKSGAKLSLEDFTAWNQNPALTDIFVKSSSGAHQLKSFLINTVPVDVQSIDAILGNAKSRPTTQQVCSNTASTGQTCTIKQVEECQIIYGRKECKMVSKEVCTQNPSVPTCTNQTVIKYYRTVPAIDGFFILKPDNFCPYGVIEEQTKTVYGRVFNERRCCESKVVNGVLTNVCSDWVAI